MNLKVAENVAMFHCSRRVRLPLPSGELSRREPGLGAERGRHRAAHGRQGRYTMSTDFLTGFFNGGSNLRLP